MSLALLLALAPTYLLRFTYFGIPGTVFEFLLITFVVWRTVWLVRRKEFSVRQLWTDARPWNWLALLLLLAATASLVVAPDLRAAAGIWKAYFLEPIVLFFFMVPMLRDERTRRLCVQMLAASVILLAAVSLYQKFTGALIPNEFWRLEATRRTTSLYGYPNAFGLFVAPLIPLFVYYAWTARAWVGRKSLASAPWFQWWPSLLFVLAALGGVMGIIFARTSGATAGLVVAALVVGFMLRRSRLLTIIIALAVVLIIILSPLHQRIADEFLLQGFSGELRRGMWSETWEMLTTRPFSGAGLAGYQKALVPFHKIPVEIYLYPHNEFLNFWTETGMAGLIIFIVMAAWILYTAFGGAIGRHLFRPAPKTVELNREPVPHPHRLESATLESLALLAAFVVIFVHGLVDVPYFKNDLAVEFWFLVAMLAAVSKE